MFLKWYSQFTQVCIISSPRHIFTVAFFFILSKKAYVEFWVDMKNVAYLPCIFYKVTSRIHGKKCYTLRSRCACVWNMVDDEYNAPLFDMTSL
jgi:hypothetical protein